MLVCTKCGIQQSEQNFRKRRAGKLGYASWCKSCYKSWEHEYHKTEKYKVRKRKYSRDRNILVSNFLLEYLKKNPCIDCGESDPVVLEFDHIKDKKNHIACMKYSSIESVEREIKKCVVRCANCHRRKTAKDFGWFRYGV